MIKAVYLIIGGIAGTFSRYYFAGFIYDKLGSSLPWGTMVVNLTGCFLIGLFSVIIDEKFLLGPDGKVLLMAGFCGAYTTFSTYMLETSNLAMGGEMLKAFLNIVLSTVVGFLALRLGILVGEFI